MCVFLSFGVLTFLIHLYSSSFRKVALFSQICMKVVQKPAGIQQKPLCVRQLSRHLLVSGFRRLSFDSILRFFFFLDFSCLVIFC